MSKLSNLQLTERIFHRINAESQGLKKISSHELLIAAEKLMIDAKDTIRCFSLAAGDVNKCDHKIAK
ncbi:hypothetical protein [Polynucleobacter sp.]|jgi:hypothetical protein|uniref:hypothetical protein n=1 Tax=Polynucleobacter sp. TaxID=2029855 RepID=UPI0027327C43|nr:hypothetical protein [Polynucleobacter sp.]MDP3121255.1 hypothetical protein [Polynucleobacter sp.]